MRGLKKEQKSVGAGSAARGWDPPGPLPGGNKPHASLGTYPLALPCLPKPKPNQDQSIKRVIFFMSSS